MYFVKKTDREEMKVEEEKAKKTRTYHKTNVIKTRPKTRWHKTYVKKKWWRLKNWKYWGCQKSPPKKGNAAVKIKSHLRLKRRWRRILQRRAPEDQEASGVTSEGDEGDEGEDFIVYAGGNEETGYGEDGENGENGEGGEDGEDSEAINGEQVEFDCSLQDKLPTISYQLSGVQYEVVPDYCITQVEGKIGKCIFAFYSQRETTDGASFILGQTFMRTVYTHSDYSNKRVGFAVSAEYAQCKEENQRRL